MSGTKRSRNSSNPGIHAFSVTSDSLVTQLFIKCRGETLPAEVLGFVVTKGQTKYTNIPTEACPGWFHEKFKDEDALYCLMQGREERLYNFLELQHMEIEKELNSLSLTQGEGC